ncbi:trans-2,3-dihydro-3-hydroxyanthranilate isomerase [bacterium BMS3Bbin10]|nr:trans-2,3-dihydro-3-hydroxyanthranilate isomerase [bacterium BMS3Bbin10]
MTRIFHTFDVFTDTRLTGNPLAVLPDAAGLEGEDMQRIAREFNLSETVFVFPPENDAHSARVRIFTPGRELPFAGHPTVGTAILLAMEKMGGNPEREEDAIIVLEEGVGPVRVGVRLRPGDAPYAQFDVPVLPEEAGQAAPNDRLAAALGLAPGDIGFEDHVATGFSSGVPFSFVPVRDLDVIGRAAPQLQHWREAFGDHDHPNAFVYCRQTVHQDAAFHARMFAPVMGVPEDPATGAAAAAFAGVVNKFDALPEGLYQGIIEQGYEMGRPSKIFQELEIEGGKLAKVRIGGHAVPMMKGTL